MVRRLLLVLLVLVLLLVAGGGLLVWRLQRGPVSLAAFTPVIDRVVAASSPYAISFSNPELTWLRSEGNLGVLEWLDGESRTILEQAQRLGGCDLLEDLRAQYTARIGPRP